MCGVTRHLELTSERHLVLNFDALLPILYPIRRVGWGETLRNALA